MDVELRDLSPPQQAEFCSWYIQDAFPRELLEQQCEADAVGDAVSDGESTDPAGMSADCEAMRDDCVDSIEADDGPEHASCREAVAAQTCVATPREFDDSIAAYVAVAEEFYASFPRCSELAANSSLPAPTEALTRALDDYQAVLTRCLGMKDLEVSE